MNASAKVVKAVKNALREQDLQVLQAWMETQAASPEGLTLTETDRLLVSVTTGFLGAIRETREAKARAEALENTLSQVKLLGHQVVGLAYDATHGQPGTLMMEEVA